jgi:hypothetical protein
MYNIFFRIFFTFVWFIFIVHSVSGYQKTFLIFSNFYKCSMMVITAQLCGQPPLHPIWQLIRGYQSRSPYSDRTATPDPFCHFLPTSTTTATSARTYHAWTTAPRHTTSTRAWGPHDVLRRQWCNNDGNTDRQSTIDAPIESATFDGGRSAGCREEGLGLGLSEERGNTFVHI